MDDSAKRDGQVRRVILIEGSVNLVILVCKTVVGISTGSMAILADAFHSLTDITNNIVAWIVIYFSSRPADREHPYGHRKFETLAVFMLASILFVIAFEIVLNAIRKDDSEVASSALELTIMLGVLVVNIAITSWQHMWAKRLNSDIIRADAMHTFADVLTSCVVIAGWQLSAMGYAWVDRLCAIGVALVIVYLAFNLIKRTLPVLLDGFAIDPVRIKRVVENVDDVKNVYQIRSRWIGNNCAIDLSIAVDPTLTTADSHHIADEIETLLSEKFEAVDISIHVEPYETASCHPTLTEH
jgi:cation diffusion facilitator family transporter